MQKHRDHERPGEEHELSDHQLYQAPAARSRESIVGDATPRHLFEVLEEVPVAHEKRVDDPQVELLKAMMWLANLTRAKPPERDFDVAIRSTQVGVGMVRDVVLEPPHVRATTQHVEGQAGPAVDERRLRVGAVVAIVPGGCPLNRR